MKEIAIIKLYTNYCDEITLDISHSITDWDEVSDEEFELLKKSIDNCVDAYWNEKYRYVILERARSKEIKDGLVADFIKQAREKEAKERDRKEAAKKAKEIKEAKKIEKEREKYEELRRKFEDARTVFCPEESIDHTARREYWGKMDD